MLFGIKTKKEKLKERELREKSESEKLLNKQTKIGEYFTRVLRDCAGKNTVYNLCRENGIEKHAKNLGGADDLMNYQFEKPSLFTIDNGKSLGFFTILAGINYEGSFSQWSPNRKGFPILQVNIDLRKKGQELYVIYSPYGGERCYPLEKLENAKSEIGNYIRNFRIFSA